VKSRTHIATLFLSFAFCIAIIFEIRSLVEKLSTVFNQQFTWSSADSSLSFSAMHGGNWNDYILQVDGRQFLRLTTGGSRTPASELTAEDSAPTGLHASLRSTGSNELMFVHQIRYSALETETTETPEPVRIASMFRPCRPNRNQGKRFDKMPLVSLAE
jgi:hypothetical protein